MQTFSTAEVARLSGLTLRQLQRLDENGILPPERKNWKGNQRRYGERELFGAFLVAELGRRKFPQRTIRQAMALSPDPEAGGFIVATSSRVRHEDGEDLIASLTRGGPVRVVALEPLAQRLRSTIRTPR